MGRQIVVDKQSHEKEAGEAESRFKNLARK
jgi:hypothetical protein